MRKKEPTLIITFHTTADAIALEKACRETGRPGRMIPVPRELSAGCGLAWCTSRITQKILKAFWRKKVWCGKRLRKFCTSRSGKEGRKDDLF